MVIKNYFMTNVLIPTDFSPASLKLAAAAVRNGDYGKCNIVLFHAFSLPDSPFDLLGGRQDPTVQCMREDFRQACKQLKDEHPQLINKIIVRTMQGSTHNLFRNFVEANDIDIIYCPDEFQFVPAHQRSLNPVAFFGKCGVPVAKAAHKQPSTTFVSPAFSPVQFSTQ